MARTVGNGLISLALIDTQRDASRTPYIDITIDGINYWSRLEYLEYHEEAYRDRAIIGLNNRDRALDDLDLDGEEFAIKLGYDTTAHGGSATDTVTYPTLWVKSHQIISDPGQRIYQIYAEGCWTYLREQKVVPGVMVWRASHVFVVGQVTSPTTPNGHKYVCEMGGTSGGTEPVWPTETDAVVADGSVSWKENGISGPYSNTFNRTHTVEEIIQAIIEGVGFTWDSTFASDGLLDVFKPVFDVNLAGFDNAAELLYRLIWMTKSYLRQRAGKVFGVVFPQESDDVDENYFSWAADWFIEYAEKTILLIPNSIMVLCNQDPATGNWNPPSYPVIIGTALDTFSIADYTTVTQPYIAVSIDNQVDADNRAAAILTRLRAETLGGRLVAPHDCRLELYDKVKIYDTRGI